MLSLVRTTLEAGHVTTETLEQIAGKCTIMAVAICPASLWTHCMFSQLAKSARGGRLVDRVRFDANLELSVEFRQRLGLEPTTHEGPLFKARHFTAVLTVSATDASSNAFWRVIHSPRGPFEAGGDFPPERLPRHINAK